MRLTWMAMLSALALTVGLERSATAQGPIAPPQMPMQGPPPGMMMGPPPGAMGPGGPVVQTGGMMMGGPEAMMAPPHADGGHGYVHYPHAGVPAGGHGPRHGGGLLHGHHGGHCDPCGHGGYFASGEWIFLDRTEGNRVVLGTNDANAILLTTQSTDYDYESGFRVSVGKYLAENTWIEGIYFGTLEHSDAVTADLTGAGIIQSPFSFPLLGDSIFLPPTGPGFDPFDLADAYTVTSSSELHNVEVNLARSAQLTDRLSITGLTGFRYLYFSEEFGLFASTALAGGVDEASYTVDTVNNLIGAQMGGSMAYRLDRLVITSYGKAGLFGNAAEQTSVIAADAPSALFDDVLSATTQSGASLAGIIEVGINTELVLTRHISLTAGYQVIHISGVALASDNLDFSSTLASQQVMNTAGSVTYHGPRAGFIARW